MHGKLAVHRLVFLIEGHGYMDVMVTFDDRKQL